ncbi:MAG: hypothetical protein ACREPN_08845 [Rudaea sp.]
MKTLLSLAVAAALSVSAAARAGTLVDVGVIDRDTGSTLPTYARGGKWYVAGVPGHRYAVRITNRTGARVMTVLSVDGVNAITGENADPQQTGYVLAPYQSTEVDGWRKSLSEIAQFNFTNLGNSYAARTGRPDNVGVIGVAVFREKQPVWRERDEKIAARESAPPMPANAGAGNANRAAQSAAKSQAQAYDSLAAARPTPKPEESLGTGHGARESSYASYTSFERANSRADEIDSVWYDSYRNLVARGVIPVPRPLAREPQAFPNRFVPDPAG